MTLTTPSSNPLPGFLVTLPAGTGTGTDAQVGDVIHVEYTTAAAPAAPTLAFLPGGAYNLPNFTVGLPTGAGTSADVQPGDVLHIEYS